MESDNPKYTLLGVSTIELNGAQSWVNTCQHGGDYGVIILNAVQNNRNNLGTIDGGGVLALQHRSVSTWNIPDQGCTFH